jgi:hypothetical protein
MEKYPVFYETVKLITVFTGAHLVSQVQTPNFPMLMLFLDLFPYGFLSKILYDSHIYPVHVTFHTQFILNYVTILIYR